MEYNSKTSKGWNDPPVLDHGVKSATPKSRITNKRIAFPLLNTEQEKPTNLMQIPSSCYLPSKIEETTNVNMTLLEKVTKSFNKHLNDDDHRNRDTAMKIEIMKDMWVEKKLTESIQLLVSDICDSIEKDDFETANQLHLKLAMDHAALCAPWIVGIKNLIHKIKH